MLTVPGLVSVYVVEQLPRHRLQSNWLKQPVLLSVLQLTIPVGLDPDTVAEQVTGEPTETGLGEQTTDVKDGAPEGPKA